MNIVKDPTNHTPSDTFTVPEELKREARWVCLGTAEAGQRPPLLRAHPSQALRATMQDVLTHDTYENALSAWKSNPNITGIAYVNSRYKPLISITLYRALRNGQAGPQAAQYLDVLGSYVELGRTENSLMALHWTEADQLQDDKIALGSVVVQRLPLIQFSGQPIGGSTSTIRSGKQRLNDLIRLARASYEASVKNGRSKSLKEQLEQILKRLQYRKQGQGYVALCPVNPAHGYSLHLRVSEDGKVLLYSSAGVPFEQIVEALNIGFTSVQPDPQPGSARPVVQRREAKEGLPKTELNPSQLEVIHNARQRLQGGIPAAFAGRGLTLEELRQGGFGAMPDGEGLIVCSDLEGKPLQATVRRPKGASGPRFESLAPKRYNPNWLSANLAQSEQGVLVVEGATNAALCWALLGEEGYGAVGVMGAESLPDADVFKRIPNQPIFIYLDPSREREQNAARWAKVMQGLGFETKLLGALEEGKTTDANEYAALHGRDRLVLRLAELMGL